MPAMLILALETSTELGSCALWRDGESIERCCPPGRSHSETLLPLVRELFAEAGIGAGQLDAVAYGMGPGAFTGLRVACGAAQGIAVAADLPLVGVSSLECMAAGSGAGQVLALLDARMGEVYAGAYVRRGEDWALQGEIVVAPPSAVPLPQAGNWQACGNAPAAYADLRERLALAGIEVVPDILPRAATLARLAVPRFRRGECCDAADAAPLYVRDKVAKTVAERLREGGRA